MIFLITIVSFSSGVLLSEGEKVSLKAKRHPTASQRDKITFCCLFDIVRRASRPRHSNPRAANVATPGFFLAPVERQSRFSWNIASSRVGLTATVAVRFSVRFASFAFRCARERGPIPARGCVRLAFRGDQTNGRRAGAACGYSSACSKNPVSIQSRIDSLPSRNVRSIRLIRSAIIVSPCG